VNAQNKCSETNVAVNVQKCLGKCSENTVEVNALKHAKVNAQTNHAEQVNAQKTYSGKCLEKYC
jgi:hypothetical protein